MSGSMERLSNRYRLVDCIGTGGMSVVWLARDEVLDRDVVVKLLGPQRPGETSSRDLIRQEAMAAAGLAHPNVTTVYDYGEVHFPDGETVPFVVMEYVRGRTLGSRLSEGPMVWPEAVRMAAEVAAALAAAHARGIVHRDIKPGNVMLTPTGVKVLDFGIAASVGTRDDSNVLLGTPAYVAPERLAGGQVHPAADVYAVGLLLYKALVGRLPWTASTATQILQSHREAPPAPLPDIPGMPERVAQLCMRCLAKKPGDRPDSATLARQLAGLVHARVPVPGPAETTALLADAERAGRLARWVRSWRDRPMLARATAGGTGVGALALLMAWAVWPAGSSDGMRATMVRPGEPQEEQTVSCQVRYRAQPSGSDDYRAEMTIVNTGRAPITDWSLSFDLPDVQEFDPGDGARWTRSGGTLRADATEANATIAPGSGTAVGFVATGSGRQAAPTRFTLNGAACQPTILTVAAPSPADTATRKPAEHGAGQGRWGGGKPEKATGPGAAPGKGKEAGKGSKGKD